ncbi:MAG: DUF262 domain-containing protein [Verrucomicrobiaceae bacterium]|nr:MAG: DUF262 domain-containing protein [Verrucomicrobiaceae bacterium]
MKAQDLQFTQLLEGSKQFIIPIFQRTYSWERSHCEQLWNDILRVGGDPNLNSHFIGSAVYIPEQDTSAAISRWLVIDGQQRITTVTLALLSLMQRLKADKIDDPVSAEQIEDSYLRNRYGKGDLSFKMLLTKTDKETLMALLEGKTPPDPVSSRIRDNYAYFTEQMATANVKTVYQGIQKLMIVDVRLQQGIDNPQMIFESMNSTGKALTQADLIRNFVLMGLPHDLQTRLYNDYWRPMEIVFGAESYNAEFDEFMRYFLVIHTGNYRIRRGDVYSEFKSFSRKYAVEELLALLKEYAVYFCAIALGKEKDAELTPAFHDIRELRADVCYPLLMELYADYSGQRLTKEEFIEIALLTESYVFRRAVCDIPTHSLRQTFATFTKSVKKGRYLESVKAAFLLLPSYRRFPDDEEFKRRMKTKNLYSFNRRSYWLRRFENHGRKERVLVQDYTIEHIMPQNDKLSAEWQADLGAEWKTIQAQYLHTLGNLTLTGYNSEYSDRPFHEKRDMDGGFKHSPLRLNEGMGSCQTWNESAIKDRATRLSDKATTIWSAPKLSPELLDSYKPAGKEPSQYTLSDHTYLKGGITRELFDALRAEVLALDECVREEILKLYIAFKAETNFLDVVPQAKRLILSINVDFPKIEDPRKLCRDVTGLGRWGNGNVEALFEKLDDLPYIMGIVSQALERQLGDEETES